MAPTTTYMLFQQYRWDALQRGQPFPIGTRTAWDINLRIASLTAGASVNVVVQVAPYPASELDYKTLVDFGLQSATGIYSKSSRIPTPPPDPVVTDFSIIPEVDVWMRAVITAITGRVVLDVQATAPFFDLNDDTHLALLPQEVREWKDGLVRTVEQSEEEIVADMMADVDSGYLDIDLTVSGATEAVRREIALQASHNRRRARLESSNEPSAMMALRNLTRGVPGRSQRLSNYRPSKKVWLGR